MYIARIKIKLKEEYDNIYYEKNKWMECFMYKDKICKWRFKENGIIDFIIGNYENKHEALKDGKILYFNILYEIHRSKWKFILGESNYITNMYHENNEYTSREFMENEEWFFNNKKRSSDFLGLGIYEIEKNIEEYDEYGKISACNVTIISKEPFAFLDNISKMDYNCKYSKSCQKIFNLVRMSEESDVETTILLLCQALETMGEDKDKEMKEIELIKKLIKIARESEIDDNQKNSLISFLESGKKISSRKKCENLINKYSKYDYTQFDKKKIFKEAYDLRSKIIHGDEIDESNAHEISYYLKYLVLDILKEWSKEKNKM